MTTPIPTRKSVAAELREAARYVAKTEAAHYRYVAALLICTGVPVEQIMAYPAPTAALGEFSRAALMPLVVPSREEYEHAQAVLAGNRGAEDFDVEYSAADRETAAAWVAQYEAANPKAWPLADGRGGHKLVPEGTLVRCNQIGHHYGPHLITPHCLVGDVVEDEAAN